MKYFLAFLFLNLTFSSVVSAQDVLLGSQETSFLFRGKNRDRAHNIHLASSKVQNFLLPPGETFSFNEIVGARTRSNGFRKAKAILRGQLVLDWGGGTCQVAGTLHSAVFQAGLEILQSKQHSRVSPYLSAGYDTTVVDNRRDFVFRNNFSFPLSIKLFVPQEGTLRAEIWGAEHQRVKIDVQVLQRRQFPSTMILSCRRLRPGQRDVYDAGAPAMLIIRKRWVNGVLDQRIIRYNIAKRITYYCPRLRRN